jgi:molybdopterin synthase catalytic subunit
MPGGTGARHDKDGGVAVNVRFYARYAELMGMQGMTLVVPAPATVGSTVHLVRGRLQNGGMLPERPMVAVNEEHALPDRELTDGDVVAFLPPLAGG